MRRVNFSLLLCSAIAGLACLILLSPKSTFAATRTWDGGGTTNNWSEDANWSDDTEPIAGDVATFNGTSTKDATIDGAVSILTLNINSGYTGTITQSADLTIGSAGAFTHNTTDGKFQWSAGALIFTGNTGSWDIDSGDDTFGDLTINKANGQFLNLTTGDTYTIPGTLTLIDGNIGPLLQLIYSQGDIVHGAAFDGGTGTIVISGNATRTINLTGGGQLPNIFWTAPNVTMNGPASGTVQFDRALIMQGGTFVQGAGNLVFVINNSPSLWLDNATFIGGSGSIDVNGIFRLTSPASFTSTTGTLFVGKGWINVGTGMFDHNNGTVTFDGSGTLTFDGTETFNDVTINIGSANGQAFLTDGETMTVEGTLTLANGGLGGFGSEPTGRVSAQGNIVQGAGFDGGYGIIDFDNDSLSQTYTSSGGVGPKLRFDSVADASDSLIFSTDSSMEGLTVTSDFSGPIPITNSGNSVLTFLRWSQAAGTYDAGAQSSWRFVDFDVTGGSFVAPTLVTAFGPSNGAIVPATWDVNGSQTFNQFTVDIPAVVSGPDYDLYTGSGDSLIVTGALTLTDGNVGPHASNNNTDTAVIDARSTITQATTFDGGYGYIDFGNNALAQTYTTSGGAGPILRFDSAADASDSLVFATAATMGLATTSGFSGPLPISNSGNNTLTFSVWEQAGGSYDASAQTLWLINKFTKTGGTFVAPVTVRGAGTWSVPSGQTLNDLTVTGSMSIAEDSAVTVDGTITLDGYIDVATYPSDAITLIAKGDVLMNSGGIQNISFGGSDIQTFDQSLAGPGAVYGDFVVNKTGGRVDMLSDLNIDGYDYSDINIKEGILNLNGFGLSILSPVGGGSLVIEDGGTLQLFGSETLDFDIAPTFATGSTVMFTGDGDAGADTYTVTSLTNHPANLTIASTDGATDTFQLGAPIEVEGDFVITSGTFDVTSSNRSMLMHGNWSNSGTFNPRSGTVTFNGPDHELFGSTTFYNFTENTGTASTLTFPAGLTQTFTHDLTLTGASAAARLSLRSSIPGTKAMIDPQGTRTLQYLDVKDNDNDNVLVADCSAGCFDSGNNENWLLSASSSGGILAPTNLFFEAPSCSATSTVQVSLTGTGVSEYLLSEDPSFVGVSWLPFTPDADNRMLVNFTLSSGNGSKTLYVQFRSSTGIQSGTYIDATRVDMTGGCGTVLPEPVRSPTPRSPLEFLASCQDKSVVIDDNSVIRAGAALLKFTGDSAVYAVESDPADSSRRILRWLVSEQVAALNFGSKWSLYVLELPEITSSYGIGEPISTQVYSGTSAGLNSRAALTGKVTYEPYIVTSDGQVRFGNSNYAKVTTAANGVKTYAFEDRDDFDYDDVVVQLDAKSMCLSSSVTALPIDAAMHSQIWLTVLWEGRPQADVPLFMDSHDAVTHIATANVANDILMSREVRIEFKDQLNSQAFRVVAFVRRLMHRLLSLY